jgi:hypothetical protein
MNPVTKRKIRQRTTDEKFWDSRNWIHTQAYNKGVKHMREDMECTPGISKRQVEAVLAKAAEIRETWDGMREVDVESSLEEITTPKR